MPFLFASCSNDNPIVFMKKTDMSEVRLALDTNGTFDYTAKSEIGATFHETGTYTVEDSLLILRFTYESFDHLCYEIPLTNDTSLIMNYKGEPMLYPTVKEIQEIGLKMTPAQLMDTIVLLYNRKDFGEYVGKRYFKLDSGDLSLIFKGNWKISPSCDGRIK